MSRMLAFLVLQVGGSSVHRRHCCNAPSSSAPQADSEAPLQCTYSLCLNPQATLLVSAGPRLHPVSVGAPLVDKP